MIINNNDNNLLVTDNFNYIENLFNGIEIILDLQVDSNY